MEVKGLLNMIFLKNSSRVIKQWKKDIIEWYYHSIKDPLAQIRSWNDFLSHINHLMHILNVYCFNLLELIKRNWDPQYFLRLIKSIHLIKWWNEKLIFIKTFIQLSINRPPTLKSTK